MTTNSPNYALVLYNATTDQSASFAAYRDAQSGTGAGSNMMKIDAALKVQADLITALGLTKGAVLVPMTYVSTSYYESNAVSGITSYVSGTKIVVMANATNTTGSGTVTLNINSLGTKSLMKVNTSGVAINLSIGDLVIGRYYNYIYNGTAWISNDSSSADTINIPDTVGNLVSVSATNGITGALAATATSDFIVGNTGGGSWIKKTLAEAKTILGLGAYTYTWPGSSATLARTDAGQTFTGVNAFTAPTVATSIAPASNDGAALGTTSYQFSDLYLAEGGKIDWDNGDAVITQTGNMIALTGANLTVPNTIEGYSTTATAGGGTTLTVDSNYLQSFTGTLAQNVILPVTSTLSLGHQFFIVNNSSGVVTVQSSGSNDIIALAPSTVATLTCILITGTDASSWSFGYGSAVAASGKKLQALKSITLDGTDATTMTFPSTSATIARIDAANTFTGASTASAWVLTSPTITTKLNPTSDDGAPLGDTTHNWSDLFLASGGVVNYANSNVVLTHTSGILTLGTGTLKITNPTNTATSVVTIDGAQTLTAKRLAKRVYSTTSIAGTPGVLTPEIDAYNHYELTAQAAALDIANMSTSTPTAGETITMMFVFDATPRAITYGTNWIAKAGVALPSISVASKMLSMAWMYCGAVSKWVLMSAQWEA